MSHAQSQSGLAAGPPRPVAGTAGMPVRSFSFLHYAERQKLDRFLACRGEFCVMFFEVENFAVFRDLYGGLISGRVMEIMEEELAALMGEHLGHCSLSYMDTLGVGGWVVLCGLEPRVDGGEPAPGPGSDDGLADVLLAFRLRLKSRIRQEALNLTGRNLDVLAGYARLCRQPGRPLEQAVYDALHDAQRMAKGMLDSANASLMVDFRTLLTQRRLTSVFQPIVKLDSGDILAWEALTRGPQGSHFRSPAVLFDFAEEVDQVFELEKVCRHNAVHGIGRLEQDQKLFLNINPLSIVDPDFTPGQTLALLEEHGLKPSDVVLEITERHSIRDFTLFHRTLEHYRTQGFKVAIDDVGTGYSGLWSIAEIRPDFLKVDMSLVQGIDANPVKRALLETFVTFSDHIGCRLIAEGIEQEKELDILMRMGVHLGQGFFLARPASPKPGLAREVRGFFTTAPRGAATGDRKCSTPVKALVEEALTVPSSATVSEVKALLGEAGPSGAAVVADKGRPLGLVMAHHLDHALSSRFGNSLYNHRSVTLVMDPSPLYAESGTPGGERGPGGHGAQEGQDIRPYRGHGPGLPGGHGHGAAHPGHHGQRAGGDGQGGQPPHGPAGQRGHRDGDGAPLRHGRAIQRGLRRPGQLQGLQRHLRLQERGQYHPAHRARHELGRAPPRRRRARFHGSYRRRRPGRRLRPGAGRAHLPGRDPLFRPPGARLLPAARPPARLDRIRRPQRRETPLPAGLGVPGRGGLRGGLRYALPGPARRGDEEVRQEHRGQLLGPGPARSRGAGFRGRRGRLRGLTPVGPDARLGRLPGRLRASPGP